MKEVRTNILPEKTKVESSLKLETEELNKKNDLCEVKRCFVKYIFNNYNFFFQTEVKKANGNRKKYKFTRVDKTTTTGGRKN